MNRRCLISCVLMLAIALPVGAQDSSPEGVRSLRAIISGNQEQPKVLYIVPWKSAEGDLGIPYRPISGQTDDVFSHIERNEHIRHLEFLQELSAPTQD